ncbi:MAG TPA: segregation/condensation protein A, partial [Bacillota bacterium]|nr:segregation/condensation protein A [Bacillota bacterium]
MAINVKLEAFEGPLDLLLHLIEKAEVDIYDIPIAEITDQYLHYINMMEIHDLEVSSEFIVMAATLLEIKSKMLLPKPKKEENITDEADPREELVLKLIEYKKYKEASLDLKDKLGIY